MPKITAPPPQNAHLPEIHTDVQIGDWLSQVGGQALPQSINVIPSGHSLSALSAGFSVVDVSSPGHWSEVTHSPSFSTIPDGQKQPANDV